MPGPTPHACVTVDSSARNQPSERDRKARKKMTGKGIRLSSHF